MSSDAYFKSQQKRLKTLLSAPAKDWEATATLTSTILSLNPSHYATLVYSSLAKSHLDDLAGAKEGYLKATEIDAQQPMAWQGLVTVNEKLGDWHAVEATLETLVTLFGDQGDYAKQLVQLEKLLDVLEQHDASFDRVTTVLETLSRHSAVTSSLPHLLKLRTLHTQHLTKLIAAETAKRRQRLTSQGPVLTAAQTLRQVEAAYLPTSPLPSVLQRILEDPDAGSHEQLRREVEGELLDWKLKLLRALDKKEDKEAPRKEVEELARGMVVVRSSVVEAWRVRLDWSDEAEWEDEGADDATWIMADRFQEHFPEDDLAVILSKTRTPPLSEPSEAEPETPLLLADEPLDLIPLPASPLSYILLSTYAYRQSDWDTLLPLAQGGLKSLNSLEKETGLSLPKRKLILERFIALSQAYSSPPQHHLTALPLVRALLPQPTLASDLPLLQAYGTLLSTAADWGSALPAWEKVGRTGLAEKAWCLSNLARKQEARILFDEILDSWKEGKGPDGEELPAREKLGLLHGTQEEKARVWWRFGKVLWDLGDEDSALNMEAFSAFQTSLLHSPSFAPSFTSLGRFYSTLSPPTFSPSLALDFYTKAFELDPHELDAARYLAEEYADEGDWGMVESVARRCVGALKDERERMAEDVGWAWKAIGGAELNFRRYPEAITAFQYALRSSPLSASTWLRLGVAYRLSGKHIAALKVFRRALQLDPASWYAEFGIGEVQRELGMLEVAGETFAKVLDRQDDTKQGELLGVRVVRAETFLDLGRERTRQGVLVRAEEAFLESLEGVVEIIEAAEKVGQEPPRSLWKIAAECCAGLAAVGRQNFWDRGKLLVEELLTVLGALGVDGKMGAGRDVLTVSELLHRMSSVKESETAVIWEGVAVLVSRLRVLLETGNEVTIGAAWHDLALSISRFRPHLTLYLASSGDLASEAASTPDEDDSVLLHSSIRCIKLALHSEPLNTHFWNALGVLSFTLSPRLAQHAFIRSVELSSSRSAVAWTNLGIFYLVHDDEELANEAFLKSQVLDPDYGPAWVGQATLARRAGHEAEASVLLEHAFGLGGTREADIGFAETAFSKYRAAMESPEITSTESIALAPAALSAPLFAITRYLAHKPTDTSALHLSALILERLGDLATATETLELVGGLLSDEYEREESADAEARFIVSQTSLGRVRLANEEYDTALGAFEAAQLLLPDPRSSSLGTEGALSKADILRLHTQCRLGIALALFWTGDVGGAVEQLSDGLDELEEVAEVAQKARLAILLSRVYYADDDQDKALGSALDIPDVSNEKAPIFVKLTLTALAILTSDYSMMELVEKLARRRSVKYNLDYTMLQVLFHLIHSDYSAARDTLASTIHARPWEGTHRRALSLLLLRLPPLVDETDKQRNLNIEVCARFLISDWISLDFPAEIVSMRQFGSGVVMLGIQHEEGPEGGAEEESRRREENAVHYAPWLKEPRECLRLLSDAMQ